MQENRNTSTTWYAPLWKRYEREGHHKLTRELETLYNPTWGSGCLSSPREPMEGKRLRLLGGSQPKLERRS